MLLFLEIIGWLLFLLVLFIIIVCVVVKIQMTLACVLNDVLEDWGIKPTGWLKRMLKKYDLRPKIVIKPVKPIQLTKWNTKPNFIMKRTNRRV